MKLFSIVSKNLKLLIRSRVSALIIIIGPLLIALLVGMAFNTSTLHNIGLGTYSPSYNELSESIIKTLEDKQFVITKMDTEESCTNGVISGEIDVCILFPENMKVAENASNTITFKVDNSRINLAYVIMNEVSKKMDIKTTELSQELTQILLNTIENSRTKLIEDVDKISQASSSTSSLESKASNIASKVSDISISFNNESLEDVLETAKNCTGCSLTTKLNDLTTDINRLISSVEEINEAKTDIEEDASSIKESAIANKEALAKTKSDLSSVISQIEAIKVKEASAISSPIITKIEPVSSNKTHWNFLFPTLVSIIVMLVSIILGSSLVMREKKTRAYFRNFITPTNEFTFLIGTYLTCLIIILLQLVIIFGQAFFILRQELIQVLLTTSLTLLITASLFIFIGMLIGYAFKSEETSVLASMSVASFLLFFSNAILPIGTIPQNLSWLATFNPFVISNSLLKKLILFQEQFAFLHNEFYMLISYLVVFLIFTFLAREITKRKYA